MAFEQCFPVFAAGPRTELNFFYGRFTVSNSGATLTASADTSQGLTMTGASGTYALAHPKCRFRMVNFNVTVAALGTATVQREVMQKTGVALTDGPTDGVLNFNTIESDAGQTVAVPADGSVVEVFALLGF